MNLHLLIVFQVFVNHFFYTHSQSMIGGNYSNNGMVDCIVQAVNLVAERKIAVEFAEDGASLVSDVLERVKVPVVLNLVEHRIMHGIEYRTSNDMLLLLKDVEVDKILNGTLWYGETRFLIVTQDEKKVEEYFESFWKRKVINVFAMVKTDLSFYSFLPYREGDCKNFKLVMVDACQEGQLRKGGSAFTDRTRLKNMNGCPVNISVTDVRPNTIFDPDVGRKTTSKLKGFEGNFVVEVSKLYNFTPNFKLAEDGLEWGHIHPTPVGTIGDLYLGVSDIAVGMLGPILERYEYLDIPSNYNVDVCVTFAVPRGYGAKKADWLTIFLEEFAMSIWILMVFSFIMIAVNMWMINRYLNANWYESKTEIALFLFSSCLGLPIKTPHYVSARTSVIFWIVFGFIVTVSYKSSMGSKLAVPPHDPEINNFDELLKSDLVLSGSQNMYQIMPASDKYIGQVRKRYIATNKSVELAVELIADRKKMAYMRHKSTFHYYSKINPKARGRIHVIDACVYPYHPCPVVNKFSPFTLIIRQIMSRLEESGIMEMWRAEYKESVPPPMKPILKLSMEQMFGSFCFLLFGYIIAFISFACEIRFPLGCRECFFPRPLNFEQDCVGR